MSDTWTQEDRRWLAEVCREHDQLMAEAREDERRRHLEKATEEAAASTENEEAETGAEAPYVQESSTDDLRHPSGGENAPAGFVAAPADDTGLIGLFGDERDEVLLDTMAQVVCDLRREWRGAISEAVKAEREKHEHALVEHDTRISRLEGQINTLLSFIGQRSAARNAEAGTLDLPNWRQNN